MSSILLGGLCPIRAGVLQAAAITGLMLVNYNAIPSSNTKLTRFDTLIVLGTPCSQGGGPSPEQRERVLEGVHEYKEHLAPRIIMTGGAAHNSFVEAHCMKELAVAQGVPAADVLEEGQAKDTIQNIWFSNQIMQAHRWRSAEVISSPSHLPRTALILQHYNFAWRTHASAWPAEYSKARIGAIYSGEIKSCWTLVRRGFQHSQWLPGS